MADMGSRMATMEATVRSQHQQRQQQQPAPAPQPTPQPTSRRQQRRNRGAGGECWNCGEPGHFKQDCPQLEGQGLRCDCCNKTGHLWGDGTCPMMAANWLNATSRDAQPDRSVRGGWRVTWKCAVGPHIGTLVNINRDGHLGTMPAGYFQKDVGVPPHFVPRVAA